MTSLAVARSEKESLETSFAPVRELEKKGEEASAHLQRLAILFPLLQRLNEQGERENLDVLVKQLSELIEKISAQHTEEEIEQILAVALAKDQGISIEDAQQGIRKAKLSIFRLFFEVFGKESMDLHAKIQTVGVLGMQVESKRIEQIQEELKKINPQIEASKHFGSGGMFAVIGISLGIMALGALTGGIAAGVAASKAVIAGLAAPAIGVLAGAKLGAFIGALVGAGMATGIQATGALNVDKGIDSGKLFEYSNEQSILNRDADLRSQALQTVMTTETSKASKDIRTAAEILRETINTFKNIFRMR